MKTGSNAPDSILYNGAASASNAEPLYGQAVAVGNGKILAVGRNEDIRRLGGPNTETVDLGGRLVVPGFTDSHIHFYEWAMQRQGIQMAGLTRLEELLEQVQAAADHQPPGRWIMGQGWNETDWVEPKMPTRDELDRVAPNHPVLLWRCDLHLAVANSTALHLAGIAAGTPDPPDGRIERDAGGAPTGILRELAINLVRKAVAEPDAHQVREAFETATATLHRLGITGIHDVRLMADKDGARAFQAFQRMDRDHRLDLRSWITLPGHQLDHIIELGLQTGFGNDRLRIGHVKFFCDGGMGARTSWMIEPFRDAGCGMPLMDMAALASDIEKADAAGLSVMVHAVGDRANRELIDIFEDLETRRGTSGKPRPPIPHRMEHVQMIRPEDAARLRKCNVALCVTPANLLLDINLIDSALGEKGKWTYAFRSLMDTGVPVMFSSDCPVCDPDPLAGIQAAVNRRRKDGTPPNGWHPENRVTVAEALQSYTTTPSAVHDRPDLGLVEPGKKADLAVLSGNILRMPAADLSSVRVDMTLFDGRIVYRR